MVTIVLYIQVENSTNRYTLNISNQRSNFWNVAFGNFFYFSSAIDKCATLIIQEDSFHL